MQDKHGGEERVREEGSHRFLSPSDKSARAVREDYDTENDRVHQSARSSKEALENAPGLSRTSARLASVSHNRCRSRRPRYRVVLFSPILDVLHVF